MEKYYYLGHYQEAFEAANNTNLKAILGHPFINTIFTYYRRLSFSATGPYGKSRIEKINYQRLLLKAIKRFKKIITVNPLNFLQRY